MFIIENCMYFLIIRQFVFILAHSAHVSSRNKRTDELKPENFSSDDKALFLTPYIESGQIEAGQRLAKVPPMLRGVKSFSGFLTVNKTSSSNLFFWLFKSRHGDWKTRPLVVWLVGGPGVSDAVGIFKEVGPFFVKTDLKLRYAKHSWTQKYNVVFFDTPVGTGYSFTKDDSVYANNDGDVAQDLYEALIQLHKLFPSLRKNKLIAAGESYGSKYIIALSHKIYEMNKVSKSTLNLAAMLIFSGFLDPVKMLSSASHLYNLGLIDKHERDKLISDEDNFQASIQAGDSLAALSQVSKYVNKVSNIIGFKKLMDFTQDNLDIHESAYKIFQDPKIRRAIHVGNCSFSEGREVKKHLESAFMRPITPVFEKLLRAESFPILCLNGQLDMRFTYPKNVEVFSTLEWPHAKDYHVANRCQFMVDGKVAGYFKTAGLFTEILVRNTGHALALSQPKWTFRIVDRFITNSSSFFCN